MCETIGIQFAVYEFMKRSLVGLPPPKKEKEIKEALLKVRTVRTFVLIYHTLVFLIIFLIILIFFFI
jgi:hypothetical protein